MWYSAAMTIEEQEMMTVLEESLEGEFPENEVPAAKQNYMELGIVYYCRAGEQSTERCIHFSPAPTGNCTFQDMEFCRWEEANGKT